MKAISNYRSMEATCNGYQLDLKVYRRQEMKSPAMSVVKMKKSEVLHIGFSANNEGAIIFI